MSACFLSNALKRAFLAFLVSNKVLFLAWQGAAKPLRGDDYVNVDDNQLRDECYSTITRLRDVCTVPL